MSAPPRAIPRETPAGTLGRSSGTSRSRDGPIRSAAIRRLWYETPDRRSTTSLLPELPCCRRPRDSPIDRHETPRSPVTDECPVDFSEVEPLDGLPSRLHDLAFGAVAEHLRREVLAAPEDALPQVVRMDLEALASSVSTADEEMDVRVSVL